MQVNVEFRSNMYRNKIAVLNSKTQKESDTKKVQGKVEDDRRYAIEAAMIKVMKARRKIDYTNLMSETTRLLQVRFTPEPAQIKVRLESLIERGYIERSEEDKRVFKYVAWAAPTQRNIMEQESVDYFHSLTTQFKLERAGRGLIGKRKQEQDEMTFIHTLPALTIVNNTSTNYINFSELCALSISVQHDTYTSF